MKISEINTEIICKYINEFPENLDTVDTQLLEALKSSAISYVGGYTGLTVEEIEQHEDITTAVLVLIADMWDNRQLEIDNSNINLVVENILSMYRVNLL